MSALLGYGKRIIDFDSQIADRTLDFRVAQQELNRSKVACFFVDELWSCEVNACCRGTDQGRPLRAIVLTVLRTASWSDGGEI
jgi:hypothetical protein